MSLLSGNTFGARLWSDNKQDAPMLPRLSSVQKCPLCGGYFMITDTKPVYSKKRGAYSEDTGDLSYEEMKEAYNSLKSEDLSQTERLELLFSMIHSYNDAFRYGRDETRTEEDASLHRECLLRAIEMLKSQNQSAIPLIAEFHREAGQFDQCLAALKNYEPENEFDHRICAAIRQNAQDGSSQVIEITNLQSK